MPERFGCKGRWREGLIAFGLVAVASLPVRGDAYLDALAAEAGDTFPHRAHIYHIISTLVNIIARWR